MLRRRLLLATAAFGALSGCTAAVPVTAATAATDPLCAQIVLATPTSLGDRLPQIPTTAQATRAWGTASAPVVLRCGVTPPGPTTQRCVSVQTPCGPAVDWLVVPDDPAAGASTADGGTGSWTFTAYGRVPAVEVHVPASVAASVSTSFLDQLGPAMSLARKTRGCV